MSKSKGNVPEMDVIGKETYAPPVSPESGEQILGEEASNDRDRRQLEQDAHVLSKLGYKQQLNVGRLSFCHACGLHDKRQCGSLIRDLSLTSFV